MPANAVAAQAVETAGGVGQMAFKVVPRIADFRENGCTNVGCECGINLRVVPDNVGNGADLNTVRSAEPRVRDYLRETAPLPYAAGPYGL